jgi:hypothetical protein
MGPKRFTLALVFIGAVASACGGSKTTDDLVASATPTAIATVSTPAATAFVSTAPTAPPVAAAATPAPATTVPTPTPFQAQTSNGCTVSAAAPPYTNNGDSVRVSITGTCMHMRAPDTGEIVIKVDGKDHGEANDVPRFDSSGHFSAKPFITQDGHVCGRKVTITVSGKYDFNRNLSDTGSTTFTLVCDKP